MWQSARANGAGCTVRRSVLANLVDHQLVLVGICTGSSKPWFMWLCPSANHAPHHAPKDYIDKYRLPIWWSHAVHEEREAPLRVQLPGYQARTKVRLQGTQAGEIYTLGVEFIRDNAGKYGVSIDKTTR
jgi:hypothetical protein